MAIVGYLDIPEEWILLFNKLVRGVDRKKTGAVARQGHLMSREKKLKVSTRSLLPAISAYWAGLTTEQKNAWKSAGSANSLNGWNLFVQDTAYRLKYGLSGLATPSDVHQYKCGKIHIQAPASGAKLIQYHPNRYWKLKKIPGTKAQYQEVAIDERLALPLEIGLSYKSDLTAQSGEAYAKFYCVIISHYQGRKIETVSEIEADLSTGWTRQTHTITEVLGVARSYNLFIDLHDVRGEFYFDNILARHTGTNWARDFRCNDVNNSPSKVNYQIETSWEEQFLPGGSAYDSVYDE